MWHGWPRGFPPCPAPLWSARLPPFGAEPIAPSRLELTKDLPALPDIFDEVEEDLRAERARALGRRYWGAVVTIAVVVVLGTGGAFTWQAHRAEVATATADKFITASQQADKAVTPSGVADPTAAAPALSSFADVAAHGPAGYRVLAQLRLAALQWQTGKHADAIASWQAVSDDKAAPALLRDLATLLSAGHQLDGGDPVLLKQRLEALTGPDNLWAPMAQQLIALIDIRAGRPARAAATMQALIANPLTPPEIKQMATDLLTTLPPDALAPAPPPPPPPVGNAPAPHTPVTPAPVSPASGAPAPAAHG